MVNLTKKKCPYENNKDNQKMYNLHWQSAGKKGIWLYFSVGFSFSERYLNRITLAHQIDYVLDFHKILLLPKCSQALKMYIT